MLSQLKMFQASESEKERSISISTRGNRRISSSERLRLENLLSRERISNHVIISSYREKLAGMTGKLEKLKTELKGLEKQIERGERKKKRERKKSVMNRLS